MATPQRTVAGMRDPWQGAAPGGKPEAVHIWLLGGFRVSVGPLIIEDREWRLKKAGGVVKLLALTPGHRLHREQAMNLLWPELGPGAAANNLHQALYSARRVLDPTPSTPSRYLRLQDEWLALCPDQPLWVDTDAFEEAEATARGTRDPAAYRLALDLYAGDLLPDDGAEQWTSERRESLQRSYLTLLVELARLHEEREEPGPAIQALERVLADEPAHEGAHAGLMRLHALGGRRPQALRQYERAQETLSGDPGPALRRLRWEILTGALPPAGSPPPEVAAPEVLSPQAGGGRHNLPPSHTSFVGRESEALEVKRLLSGTRLLTLTGTGGCGKTRLTLETAKDLVGDYPDGVWLVELAAIQDPALVPRALAAAVGAREQPGRPLEDTLVDSLRSSRMLVILDNCEHLVDACAGLVDTLLSSCGGVRVLATSREPLGTWDEVNLVVPSLAMPPASPVPPAEELPRYESVRLFMERALARQPTFVLTPGNAEAVVEVCRRLEGIPLAIELATARMTVLSVEQVAERLENSLKLLATRELTSVPRQRTLEATLDWSYEVLAQPERRLFGRLSVFAGGWTLEAAEAVGAGDGLGWGEVLDLLSGLVDKSLVVAEAGKEGTLRYKMLEPLRQYARERLEASGEADASRRRHAGWFLALAERADPGLRGPRQVLWLERLDTEQDNLRTAMAWLLEKGDLETVARLGWALWLFWWIHGHFTEGRWWMEEALAMGVAMSASSRARILLAAGTMADGQADRPSAKRMFEESLRLFKELDDKLGVGLAVSGGGLVAVGQGRHERGIRLLQEALDIFLELDNRWYASVMLSFLAAGWLGQGDHDRAKRLAERGLALAREVGNTQSTSIAFYVGATVAQAERDHGRARRLLGEGLALAAKSGDETNVAFCLEGLAAVAASQRRIVRAARLWGAAEARLEAIETTAYVYAPDRSLYESQVAAARDQLDDEAAWDAAWTEGRAMTPERAREYALAEQPDPPALGPVPDQQPANEPAEILTHREQEIALLVARGLTNRQIASELVISEHTVIAHLRKIRKKLGVHSRTQIAALIN